MYQNAKQETLWATIEGRLMAMLEGVKELTLERLNEVTQAWVELDYHYSTHSEIGTTPLRRHLDAKHVRRECPDSAALRQAFRCTVSRKQRRSDGTISLSGVRFEIPGRYRHLEQPTLRYARWNLRCVDLIDPRTLEILCPLYPLDKSANASGARRNLADFYREMGDLFGVELRPHNRWGGFKALRERWLAHLEGTLLRPVLLIDEAQEMQPQVLSELRLLSSMQFDSRNLLSVVLAGDGRLNSKLRRDELLPLGSRIRTRLIMEYVSRDELTACLNHLLATAGNASLMTPELKAVICDHAIGNYRVLTGMGDELLASAAQKELTQLDEKLFLELYGSDASQKPENRLIN